MENGNNSKLSIFTCFQKLKDFYKKILEVNGKVVISIIEGETGNSKRL